MGTCAVLSLFLNVRAWLCSIRAGAGISVLHDILVCVFCVATPVVVVPAAWVATAARQQHHDESNEIDAA